MIMNKGFWYVWSLYVVMFLLDLGSTLRVGYFATLLEANPLFKIGGFWLIGFVNLLLMLFFVWAYVRVKSNPTGRFVVVAVMVIISLVRVWCVWQALHAYDVIESVPVEDLPQFEDNIRAEVTDSVKWQAALALGGVSALLGVLVLLPFFFWNIDHVVKKKGGFKK